MAVRVIKQNESANVADIGVEFSSFSSFQQQLAAVALVKRMCETYSSRCDLYVPLDSLQNSVRSERVKSGTQETMTNLF